MGKWVKRFFPQGIPLYFAFSGLLASFMLAFFLLIWGGAWLTHQELAQFMADRSFSLAVRNVRDGFQHNLQPFRDLVKMGSNLEIGDGSFRDNVSVLLPFFLRSLSSSNAIFSLSYSKINGDFFIVEVLRDETIRSVRNAPDNAAYLLRYIEDGPDGHKRDTKEFRSATFALLDQRETESSFDPRTNPWYSEAQQYNGQLVTKLYSFFEHEEMGIASAVSTSGGQSVFTLKIRLRDIDSLLLPMPVSPHGMLILIDGKGDLLALSGEKSHWSHVFLGKPLIKHPDAVIQAVGKHLLHPHSHNASPHLLHLPNNEEIFLSNTDVTLGDEQLHLIVTAPVEEFSSVVNPFFSVYAWYAVILSLFLLPLSFVFARWLTKGFRRLATDLDSGHPLPEIGTGYANSSLSELRYMTAVIRNLLENMGDCSKLAISLQERIHLLEKQGKSVPVRFVEASESPQKADSYPEKILAPKKQHCLDTLDSLTLPSKDGSITSNVIKGKKILLAESDATNVQAMTSMLQVWEARVDVAKDGLETAEKAWIGDYALIIVSRNLLGIDALQLASLLRRTQHLDKTPILMLGGTKDEISKDEISADPKFSSEHLPSIQDCIALPIRPDVVRLCLEEWLVKKA